MVVLEIDCPECGDLIKIERDISDWGIGFSVKSVCNSCGDTMTIDYNQEAYEEPKHIVEKEYNFPTPTNWKNYTPMMKSCYKDGVRSKNNLTEQIERMQKALVKISTWLEYDEPCYNGEIFSIMTIAQQALNKE